jgi:membrane-anchored glycerophosphoryl diester phosphodiesterase (GDPDase)
MTTTTKTGEDLEIPSIFFGVFTGLFALTISKVAKQSWQIWRRRHSFVNWYLWMIWLETIVNMVFALTTYLFIRGNIAPR